MKAAFFQRDFEGITRIVGLFVVQAYTFKLGYSRKLPSEVTGHVVKTRPCETNFAHHTFFYYSPTSRLL